MIARSPTIEYAVIAGSLKGRVIAVPDSGTTRPPLTRLRRSIYDFLVPYLDGADLLDLFSGTGSYLFEAVSRGVNSAVGVEMEPALVRAINQYAEKFGVADRLRCLEDDVFAAIPKLARKEQRFDVIMIAPPQYQSLVNRTLSALRERPVAKPGGLIVCQHDSSETKRIAILDFPLLQQRRYGHTTFTILEAIV